MSSQGVSVFRPQSKAEDLQKASSSTQTAISVYFGSSFPIQLFMQLQEPMKKTESKKNREFKKEKDFEIKKKKEIEEFKKFSSSINVLVKPKPLKKCPAYTYDPNNEVDEKIIKNIGDLLVENFQKDDEPITF